MIRLICVILLCVFSLCSVALGTTFFPQPFPSEVQGAPVIVRGTVGMSYSDWGTDEEGTRRLYTYYEVQSKEVFKGSVSQSHLVIREVGGEKDGVGLHIPGTSQFDRGEDVVVFLQNKNTDGSYDVRGMMMGKYNIQSDSNGSEYLVGPGLMSLPSQAMIHEHNEDNSGTKGQQKWTLDSLRHLIRTQAESSSGSASPHRNSDSTPLARPSLTPATPHINSPSPAPQLQTPSNEETGASNLSTFYGGIAFGVLGAIGLLRLLSRKK